jgi:hypothetical protein
MDEEVFFVDRYYWIRRDGGWYRSPSHRGGWVLVPARAVPGRLVKIPPGHYKHWKGERGRPAPAAYERHERRGEHDRDRGEGYDRDRGDGHGRGKHGKHGKD